MFGTELLNARQMADELGISYTYCFKLIKNGCPYHQLTERGRKYYLPAEVKQWLTSRGNQA